jgi:excisionase family DNA binding protein
MSRPPHRGDSSGASVEPAAVLDAFADLLAGRVAAKIEAPQIAPVSPWMDAEGAAEYIACGPRRIYDLSSSGRIPVHREGNRLLFHRGELDEWLRSGAATGPAKASDADTRLTPPEKTPRLRAVSGGQLTPNEEVKRAS